MVYWCKGFSVCLFVFVFLIIEKNLREGEILGPLPRMPPNTTAVLATGPLSPLRHQQPDCFIDTQVEEIDNSDPERNT